MIDTTQSLPIEIRHRWEDRVVYRSETAKRIAEAVVEAVRSGANLRGANLRGADLCCADLRGANLRGANLRGAELFGADLRGANLRGTDLSDADLRGANLCGADLCGAKLYGARLRGADLRGADLRGTDLSDADLFGADLRGANLRGANLCGAEITATAAVSFTGQGQCGRQLLAVRAGDSVMLWCSCFHGTPDDLRAYIAGDEPRYSKTRTLALDTVLALLDAKNDE